MLVFNISPHRSGTTSIHKAMEILGFKSHHWADVMSWPERWARNPEEIRPDIKDGCAYGDLPVAMMYRWLKKEYPTARFVMVLRDRKSWVESVLRHLERDWPDPHPVHTIFYGYPVRRGHADPELLLRVRDRFVSDVLSEFAGLPNLLVMRFEDLGTLGWHQLGVFLGKDVPGVPFPVENRFSV